MNAQVFAIIPEEDDILKLMEGIIDEEYIRNETGEDDLTNLVHLTLVINTSSQSIYDLHHFLPNLQHLVLDNSVISTVRDLGTGLRYLKSLSLASCGLYDLDGIGVLTSLQELCLRDNHIADVTPLAMHENLETLNLSENKISDLSIVDSLSSCLCLRALFLSRNPLTKARNYRLIVASLVPGLQMLDGTPVDPQASKKVTNGMILESAADMRMAEEDLDDELRLENDILGGGNTTASKAEATTSSRSTTSSGQGNGASECLPDTGSELTHGSSVVLAGSMAAAVRKRRQMAGDNNNNGQCDQLLEYESTLDMLDAALHPTSSLRNDPSSNHGSRKGSQPSSRRSTPRTDGTEATSFFKEGDVTASFLGHASPQVDDDEEDAPFDPNASPHVRRRDADRDRDRSLKDGLASPAMNKSAGTKASTKRGGSTTMSMSFEADMASSQQRPKSAGPKRSVNGLPSPGLAPVSSPRQRNSSRPQSAISVGSPKQEADYVSANAAPFKVAVDKQRRADDVTARVEASPPLPQIKPAAPGSSIVHLDIVRRAPASGYMIAQDNTHEPMGHGLIFPGMANDDEDSETEDIAVTHAARHRLMASSSVSNSAHSVTANLKSRQNILQQLKATSGKADPQEEDLSPDEHGQDLDIDTHEGNRKLNADPSVGRFDIVGIAARGDNTSRGNSRRGSRTGEGKGPGPRGECDIESLELSPQRPPVVKNGRAPKDTMSSKAGISLGFNLAGSLAAIDKWVQDMNSEDEDNSHSDGNHSGESSDNDEEDSAFTSMARKKSLLFALAPPLALDKEKRSTSRENSNKQLSLDGMDNPSGLETNSKDSFSEYSNSSGNRPKNKILSRDAIISMCTGGGRDSARDSARDSDEEDSDCDVPDLRVNLSRRTTPSDEIAPPAAQTAPVRKRDADVRNRLKRGASHGTPRATPKRPEANEESANDTGADGAPATMDVPVETTGAREVRTRVRRVVPDFPVVEQVERIAAPVREPVLIDEVSPPRYTAPTARTSSNGAALDPEAGPAVAMTDTELVHLLRQQPKHTEQLKTKHNFQAFFKKINEQRMRSLLLRAYADIAESTERNEKVEKRMNLLDGFLS